jgi:hypothetical protein
MPFVLCSAAKVHRRGWRAAPARSAAYRRKASPDRSRQRGLLTSANVLRSHPGITICSPADVRSNSAILRLQYRGGAIVSSHEQPDPSKFRRLGRQPQGHVKRSRVRSPTLSLKIKCCVDRLRAPSKADIPPFQKDVRSTPDWVAKVFLRHATQILRAIGATIEQ